MASKQRSSNPQLGLCDFKTSLSLYSVVRLYLVLPYPLPDTHCKRIIYILYKEITFGNDMLPLFLRYMTQSIHLLLA